jgi:hypothetical protein
MRSYFYLIDMRVFRSSPPFFFGLLFDPHAYAYNPFNSQRYTLMAEDAVESAGAKAPAITISIQQFIAGLEVLCHQTIDVGHSVEFYRKAHADFSAIWKDADVGLPITSLKELL